LVARSLRAKLAGGHPTDFDVPDQTIATATSIDAVVQKTPFQYPVFAAKIANI